MIRELSGLGLHPLGERHWRAVAVARPGMLALVVALTAAARDDVTNPWWLVALALVAVTAGLAQRTLPHAWLQAAAEMTAAAVIVGLAMRESYLGLPYLLLPAFAGGLAGSVGGAALCTGAGTAGLLIGLLIPTSPLDAATVVSLVPWVPMIFATGSVGAWVRRQQATRPADVTRYGAAYRLLSELRVLSRRLSGGLDPVALADGLLDDVYTWTDAHRAALLVRREGGILLPLARRGGDDSWLAKAEEDSLVMDAWTTEAPANATVGRREHRLVIPLRVGSRTIGVVVADVATPVPAAELATLARSTDDGALRLETALLFDEVREIATREERRRLAREIHDGIAQELASLGYLIDDLQARAQDAELRSLASTLRKEVTRVLSDLRHSIFDLRSDVPADVGIGTALAGYAREVGSQSGLTVHLVHEESQERLRPEVEAELLRIGQEAITNVRNHAKARNLWVTVSVNPPAARVQVADDGVGLGVRPRDRYGLDIMAERARRVGATLLIENRPAGGTVVDVSLGVDEGKR
ncbi:MAG TPA: histidine kinase [Jiangellaceae bacterium]